MSILILKLFVFKSVLCGIKHVALICSMCVIFEL